MDFQVQLMQSKYRVIGYTFELQTDFSGATHATFINGQLLDTEAEGLLVGRLQVLDTGTGTVKAANSVLEIVGNNQWGTTGAFTPDSITKEVGKTVFCTVELTSTPSAVQGLYTASGMVGVANREYVVTMAGATIYNTGQPAPFMFDTASNGVPYRLAFVMGGYNSVGVAYKTGDTPANFTYGCTVFIDGGVYTDWTLYAKYVTGNTSPLYFGAGQYYIGRQIDLSGCDITEETFPEVLQPDTLDTFTDSDSTAIADHTPDVGSAGTVLSGGADIQSNQFNATSITGDDLCHVTWDASADIYAQMTIKQATNKDSLSFRVVDADNMWYAEVTPTDINLWECDSGVCVIHDSAGITKAAGKVVTVRTFGNKIKIFYDNTLKAEYISTLHQTATKVGIRTDTIGNKMDNLVIHSLQSSKYDVLSEVRE